MKQSHKILNLISTWCFNQYVPYIEFCRTYIGFEARTNHFVSFLLVLHDKVLILSYQILNDKSLFFSLVTLKTIRIQENIIL